MGEELRRHVRRSVQVEFRGRDASGIGELSFQGADVSVGGSFLSANLLLEQGEPLSLEFRVPGLPRVMRAQARVAWVRRFPAADQQGGMGVEFIAMPHEDQELLARYLAAGH